MSSLLEYNLVSLSHSLSPAYLSSILFCRYLLFSYCLYISLFLVGIFAQILIYDLSVFFCYFIIYFAVSCILYCKLLFASEFIGFPHELNEFLSFFILVFCQVFLHQLFPSFQIRWKIVCELSTKAFVVSLQIHLLSTAKNTEIFNQNSENKFDFRIYKVLPMLIQNLQQVFFFWEGIFLSFLWLLQNNEVNISKISNKLLRKYQTYLQLKCATNLNNWFKYFHKSHSFV